MFLFQKIVDRSTLRQGFQIPVEYHHMLQMMPGGCPKHGETRKVTILLDGQAFDAQLKNQGFDQRKFKDHADVIQIRYNENSPLAEYLRKIFFSTWNYAQGVKSLPENVGRKINIKIPQDLQESLTLSVGTEENVFIAECITSQEKNQIKEDVSSMDELDFETFTPIVDSSATIKEMTRVQRIRYLDRSVGDSLKRLYGYRCQMTGEKIGDGYNVEVVEAHHLIPFTQSMNNDSSNIIIISPNYHRIIHSAKPEWHKEDLSFHFPNGLVEKVSLNLHLKVK